MIMFTSIQCTDLHLVRGRMATQTKQCVIGLFHQEFPNVSPIPKRSLHPIASRRTRRCSAQVNSPNPEHEPTETAVPGVDLRQMKREDAVFFFFGRRENHQITPAALRVERQAVSDSY